MTVLEPYPTSLWRTCKHPNPEVRIRTRVNRTQVYVLQCMTCGQELRSVAKNSPDVLRLTERIPFDEELPIRIAAEQDEATSRWQQQRNEAYELARAETERLSEDQNREWWDWYNTYLKTPEWQRKRVAVLARSQGMCEGCRINKAVQVHHLTYDHVGDEFLWELVAVCLMCHSRLHPRADNG